MKCLTPLRIVAICGYFFMAFVASAQNAPNKQYAPHQLVLQLNKAIATEQAEATIAELLQGQVGKISPTHNPNLYVVALPDVLYLNEQRMADPAAIAQHFGEQPHPYLAFAEPNYRYDMATTPNDPGFAQQWSLFHPTNKHINAPDAWTMNHDCNDVVVGVIDSGIDWRHADLVDNIWQNMGEDADGDGHVLELVAGVWQFDPGDIDSTDNDNNGYKDDFIGWDFVNNDNNPMDDNGHGTGMAGVIGAKANNAQGISGLCWTVKMMALKYLDSDGGGYTANATDAVRYATAMNATMTNNSWGGVGSSVALQNAIQDAATHNQLFVTSSGNNSVNIDTNPFYPANYPINNIVCVGASGVSGNLASFSSFGYNNVDLLAPGVDIYTTKPGNTYTSLNGTSLATALVTGVAALSYCNHPSYTDLKTHLLSSVDVQTNFDGICATSGRLNAFKTRAIADCCSNDATFSASSITNCSGDQITFTNTSTNGSNYQWSVDGVVIPTYTNPLLYNFSSGGTHTIVLFSTDNDCIDATYQTINSVAPLDADFTYYSNNYSAAFFVPAATGVTYTWNFGDNSPVSNNSNAVHTYTAAGTYTVCLNAQNVCDTLQTCQDINVSLSTDCGNAAPPIEWQNTIGGSYSDYLEVVRPTNDGGYILGGSSSSDISGDKTGNNKGGTDYWIVKLAADGTIQNQRTIGGSGDDYLADIQPTVDGGYILGGYSNSPISGDKTEDGIGSNIFFSYYDYWVVKLSVTGSIEWQNTIGGNNDDYLQSIQQTTDGGYILGGSSYSGISGDKTESNQGMYDYWIVKLFATGVIQWQNTIGGNDYDQLQSLQQTTNGGYVVGGSSYSGISGDKTSDNKGGLDFWVVGLNANGAIQWQKNIGGSEDDNLATIKQTVDGGYILGGTSKSGISNQKTENSQGLNDYWIIKISSIGEIQWQNTIGGSGEDFLIDIHQTIDGTYMVGGYSSSGTSGDKTAPNMGSEDYWILKLSSLGIIQWQNTIGGNHSDKLSHIQQTTDGGYIMGGDSNSPISGNKTEGNQGGSDYWVMKFTSVNDNPLAVDFSLPTTNCVSEPLTFTNNSNGNTYQWLIDGLFVSNDADLNYSFAQPGAYTITLIGANSICNDTSTRIFNIAAPSTINYSSSVNGSTVYLSALGANNCAWDFGDGTSSNNITTQHTYSIVGTYEVCLTYTVECGTFSTCNSITTQQLPNCPSVGSVMGQNTIGGNGIDQLACFQPTADGGYILGGYSHSNISGDKTEAVIGGDTNSADYWVVKLSATSAIEWQNTIGGDGHDRLTCLQQTADGGYILGGYSGSGISGDKTENVVGNDIYYDYWVVKLSANGTIQWQNTIGGNYEDYLQSIEQTTDGGYILGGYSRSNMSIDKTENVVGYTVYYDYWVVKLSANGTIQWQNTIGGFNHDYLKSIKQTADGGYILGGYSNSGVFGDKTEANQGYNDYWVVKLSATGTIQWQNTIGGNYEDYLESIEQTADGGYILGGYSSSGISGDKTEISQSGDYWVVKLAATGTIEWQNTIGGSNEDYLKSIEQTTDGGYILGGYSKSGISGDKTVASKGGYDYWVVKVSNSGTIQWQNSIGGNSDDFLQCIQQTTDNNYVLAGYSKSNASGDKNEGSIGLEDYWIVKIKDDIYASADFQTPPIACKNGIVMFNNTSNELSTSYQWQIDGVPVSTNTNLSYSFATIGTHTVTLVADNDSCTSSKSRNIKIVEPKFICTNNGLNVHLEANGNNEISHTWDFGDGNTAIGTTVNHTYNNPGIYTICLTDECGNSDCQSIQLYISNYCLHRTNVEGQNTIGGNLEDLLAFVQQTSDGGYIAGGYSSSSPSDDKTEGTVGGNFAVGDYWVVKFSSLDTIEWQNVIGGNSLDYLQSLYQTADGGYILGGYSQSDISGDKTESSQGYYDYWVVKLATDGTIQTQKNIGGNSEDYLTDIQQTSDGGYILGGYSNSSISGNKTEGVIGGNSNYYDYWVVKLSSTGTIEWQNTIGGNNDDYLQSIQQTTDGGYILGGYSNSGVSGDKTEGAVGVYNYNDYWIVKLSAMGTIEWQNTIGGNSSDYLQSIQQTTDGGYILGGYSNSGISGDKTTAPKGASDYWVVKLSTTGTIEWQNTIGGSGYEQLEAIQQTTDGGYILGGASSSGISGDKTEASKGSSDYWVVKISNVGDVSWERTIGGNGSDYLQDIQQTIDGGYILGGSSTSGISGDKTEASYPDFFGLGAGDFWIVKLSDINTNPPLARFTAPTATFLYAPTTFTNTTTDYINTPNAGTTPSSYQWLIDDVPIATSTHLTHTFTELGTYNITLVADNGDCVDTRSKLVTVLDKGVWPGDANNDGTVSMLDYLAWGIAADYVDVPRLDQSIDWSPKFAGDYNQNFGGDLWSNTNYKHADCNGNGVINGSDTTAIVQNFGLSYLPTPPLVNNTTPQATLTLENNTPLIAANALASFSLQLQNTLNGGVVNAYGLAFTLHYNGIENPSLDFSESCWGIIGTDFHVLLIPDANNHQIHVGITRTDHNNRLLLGEVLELQGIVTAALGSNVTVSLSDIVLLNAEAYQIPAVGTDAAMQVSNSTPPILLEVKTLLQCSVTDVSISNSLMTNNYSNTLPTQQPFNTAPWNYNGSENGTIPANAVDWMLLELRNATNQVVGRKAVLLLSNGYLQEVGTPLQANRIALYGVDVLQNYYVVLRNRTHQTIASSNTLSINNNLLSVDFTQDPAQTTGGIANLVEMNGWYAMKRTAITPVILGNTNVCGGQPKNYSNTNALAGLTYAWEVSGGTIVSGQGTNTVSVQWTNATATGTLTLTATDRLCNETATASITVNLTPDAVIIVGGNASGGGVAGVTSHNLCPTCKVYFKSNYTDLTTYTLKWYKNNNELTQYQNYLGGYVKKAGNYKLKVVNNATGCEDFSQTVTITGGQMAGEVVAPHLADIPMANKTEDELLFESEQLQLSLSPNPTRNEVTLHYESGDNQSLQLHIYNLMGQLQYEQNLSVTNRRIQINLHQYPAGTYLVQLLGDREKVVQRLLVVK